MAREGRKKGSARTTEAASESESSCFAGFCIVLLLLEKKFRVW
jgi:hypothetical protein